MTHSTKSLTRVARQVAASFPDGRPPIKLDLAQPCVPIAAGGHFALLDERGTMDGGVSGYYVHETRMLDRLYILVNGQLLRLRSFTTDVFKARYVYTNDDQTLLIERDVVICSGITERLKFTSFTQFPERGPQEWLVCIFFAADFRAMAEIRDMGPTGRGNMLSPVVRERAVTFAWEGEDALRTTTIRFNDTPDHLDAQQAEFTLRLDAGESRQVEFGIGCRVGERRYRANCNYQDALVRANRSYTSFIKQIPRVETGSPAFQGLLKESLDGLYMLLYRANKGILMAAGLPWYFCLFGRDICIWILQCGWLFPELAEQVLITLSKYQAHWFDEWTEAVPGQVPHECREDQLGMMKQIVYHHCCYAVDTAPLFVVAACQVARWTGNRGFVEAIYDSLKRADSCMARHTLEDYIVFSSVNRVNKFWMEEDRSVTDEHGQVPPSPKAVCDIQGFAWQARTLLAELADSLGDGEFAAAKRAEADRIRSAFNRDFWDETLQFPVMAIGGIGGERHPCRVYHTDALLLPPGFLSAEQEAAVARRAAEPDLCTPWGILPVSSKGRVFQPFYIQSQCVCPFQTVMGGVAWFLRNGMADQAHQLIAGLMDARERIGRLPELFIVPTNSVGPIEYAASQIACYPQLWTAGAAVQAAFLCSGITTGTEPGQLVIKHASIPRFMPYMKIRGLRIMGAVVDFDYRRKGERTIVNWKIRSGKLQIKLAD